MSEDYEKWDDELDEAGEEININLDDWKDDEESSTSPVEGVTTSSATSSSAQPDIVSTLYAVFKGEKEPQFGIGYDWDMLFAVYMRKANVKPKEATGMAWNAATVAEFKSAVSNGDEASFARAILTCVGGSDVCKVSAEVLGVTGSQTSKPEVIKGITQNLIKKYFAAYGVSVSAEGITCKQAYELVNKPHEYEMSPVASDLARSTIKTLAEIYKYALDIVPLGVLLQDASGEYKVVGTNAQGRCTNGAASLSGRQSEYLSSVLQKIKESFNDDRGGSLLNGSLRIDTEKITAFGDIKNPERQWSSLIDVWLKNKYTYLPILHLGFSLGYYPTDTGLKRSLKFADLKDKITLMVNSLFSYADMRLAEAGYDLAAIGAELNALSKAVTNVIFVEEFNSSKLFTISYKLGDKTQQFSSFLDAAVSSRRIEIFLNDNIRWLCPIKSASCGLQVARLCYDREAYEKDINFAFKAVRDLAIRGKPCDFSHVLLGKTLQGDDVTINMSVQNLFCVPIMAGSGSGKGVMTLATLGTAIATRHPFIYLDYKPDMADLLWWIEYEMKVKHGLDIPILAIDASVFSQGDKLENVFGEYIPSRIKNNMYRNKDKFVSFIGKNAGIDIAAFAKMALLGKMTQLILSLDDGRWSGDRCVAVLDELNTISDQVNDSCNAAFQAKIQRCNEVIGDKKADEASKQTAEIELNMIKSVIGTCGFKPPEGKGKYAIYQEGNPLSNAVMQYLNTSGRQNNALLTICIGQNMLSLKGQHKDFYWSPVLGVGGKSEGTAAGVCKILGKSNGIPQEYAKTGFFEVDVQDESGNVVGSTICKSYLTLNENDYFTPSHRKDNAPRQYTGGIASGRSDAWIAENLGTESSPNEAVGFMGYVKEIAGIAPQPMSEQELYQTLGLGYQRAMDWFSRSGLQEMFGYSCIEDWLFDLDPSSFFKVDALKACNIEPYSGNSASDDGEAFSSESFGDEFSDFDGSFSTEGVSSQDDLGTSAFNNEEIGFETSDGSSDNSSTASGTVSNGGMQSEDFGYSQAAYDTAKTSYAAQQATYASPNMTSGTSTAPQQSQFSPPVPIANPQQTTQSCTSYSNAYTEPISFGEGSDTPFACFHSGGKFSNLRIRKAISEYLIKEIKKVYGGFDAVTSIEEQNGVLIINNMPFTPKLDEATVVLAPYAMQADLRRGAYASVMFYKKLRVLKRLQYLAFETSTVVDLFFYDNNIKTNGSNIRGKCRRLWKQLRVLRAYGENLLEEPSAEQQPVREKREREVKERQAGSSIGALLASAMGIETSTADKHPVATQIGKTKLAKAVKTGGLVAGMSWGMSLLLGLSNPFLIVGGAITAAAYAKSKWDEHRINRSAITAATSTRNKRDEHRTNRGK